MGLKEKLKSMFVPKALTSADAYVRLDEAFVKAIDESHARLTDAPTVVTPGQVARLKEQVQPKYGNVDDGRQLDVYAALVRNTAKQNEAAGGAMRKIAKDPALAMPYGDDKTRYAESLKDEPVFGAGPEGVVLNDDLIDTSVHPSIKDACNRMAAEEHAGLCSNLRARGKVEAPPVPPIVSDVQKARDKLVDVARMLIEQRAVCREIRDELTKEREYSENLRKRCEELAAEVKAQKERYDVLASSQDLTAERVMYIHGTGQGQRDAGLPCPIHDGTATTVIRILGWRSRD